MSMMMCDKPTDAMVNMGDVHNNVILHAQINILWSFSHQCVADGSEAFWADRETLLSGCILPYLSTPLKLVSTCLTNVHISVPHQ